MVNQEKLQHPPLDYYINCVMSPRFTTMINPIQAKCEIFKEDDLYVALCPELDVSSFGETIQEAKASLEEVLLAFLEECERTNTL